MNRNFFKARKKCEDISVVCGAEEEIVVMSQKKLNTSTIVRFSKVWVSRKDGTVGR